MNKEEVFQFLIEHSKHYCQEKLFIKKFPEYYQDLSTWVFPSDFKFQQKIYHYFHNDPELKLGVCPVCGNRCTLMSFIKGYSKHCSYDCEANDINEKNRKKETCKKKYGVDHYVQCNEFKKKAQETALEKFGVLYYAQTKECHQKMKETCLNRYGVENYAQTDECKRIVKEKMFKTKRKNKTFTTSKIEDDISSWLTHHSIRYIRQYKSDKYPYLCDFYLSDYDLYIEIQGNWTHGHHPFDKNNDDDICTLSLWEEKSKTSKYYRNTIDVWTIRDVRKRETAKNNGLNYLEIFSTDLNYCVEQILNRLKSGA